MKAISWSITERLRGLSGLGALLLFWVGLCALPGLAAADEVTDLIALVERQPAGMERDAWREKRRDAVRKLGALGDKRAVPALIRVVETEQFDAVGELSIEALGKIGDERAVPALRAVIADASRDRYVRDAAREALRKIGVDSGADEKDDASSSTADDPPGDPMTEGGATGADTTPAQSRGATGEAPSFDADLLGATESLTFALGGARLDYDTVRKTPSLNGDVRAMWLRTRDRERSAYRLKIDGAVVAGITDYEGDGESTRYTLLALDTDAEARMYAEGSPVYGLAAGGIDSNVEAIKVNLAGTDDDVNEVLHIIELQAAVGGGYGRILEMGEVIRVRRIEKLLGKAGVLGRPIGPDLVERILESWWTLRREVGAHQRLLVTVAILRDAGVLLEEPDASVTYQILQVLLDGQLNHRPSGLDIHGGVAETYRIRDDLYPIEDGRIESVFAGARYARQSEDGSREIVGTAYARYRALAEDGEPSPWAAGATAAWRNYRYGQFGDPIGALELVAETGISTDGFDDSELASRLGGQIGWMWIPNRASRFRLAGHGRIETGEVFVGAVFEAAYGLLDASYVGSAALR